MKVCQNCGRENPEDAVCCKNCGSLFDGAKPPAPSEKKNSAVPKSGKILIIVLSVVLVAVIAAILFLVLSGRPVRNQGEEASASETQSDAQTVPVNSSVTPTGIADDTAEGLLRTRIPKSENLSDAEKLIAEYFDSDYFVFHSRSVVSNLLAQPDAFQGVRINSAFRVNKIIESDGSSFQILGGLCPYDSDDERYNGVISGTFQGKHLVVSDYIYFMGTFVGMKSITIDGKSYYVPEFSVDRYEVAGSFTESHADADGDPFTQQDISLMAKTIFGENITIRNLTQEENGVEFETNSYYVVEFTNQNHLYFQKYLLWGYGNLLYDMTTPEGVERAMHFMPDFRHYLVAELDSNLSTFTLNYYDADLNKVWNREFKEIDSVAMDYTEQHIYLTAGQKLYILSMEDGSDQIEPVIVGKRNRVYKMADGLLLLGTETADGLIKTDLSGNILWSVTLSGKPNEMQFVNGNYVLNGIASASYDETYFIEVVTADGQIIYTVPYDD